MTVSLIDEYNDRGHLIYIENLPGAYVRGRSREEALEKLPQEVESYMLWAGMETCCAVPQGHVVQEKYSRLAVEDADSDVIFRSEREPMLLSDYSRLRSLALRSAADFQRLFDSVPDKDGTVLEPRDTFYGKVPLTARQMYEHTMNVNSYYYDQLGVDAPNGPDILSCRKTGFERLEEQHNVLTLPVMTGSWDEEWSIRKLMRRFIWHDRIHARAMYRMASRLCGKENIADPFFFDV